MEGEALVARRAKGRGASSPPKRATLEADELYEVWMAENALPTVVRPSEPPRSEHVETVTDSHDTDSVLFTRLDAQDAHASGEPPSFTRGEMYDLDEDAWDSMDAEGLSLPAGLPSNTASVKEVCRLIRLARRHWDAHHNAATRMIRRRALRLYLMLSPQERSEVPQVLRVWLRYRSEKYFGPRKKQARKPRS